MKIVVVLVLLFLASPKASAYLLTEDLPALGNNIANEIKNYATWLKQEFNQEIQLAHEVTEITNQMTQITNEVTALTRFGNPNTYVNMLGLTAFMNSVSNLENGIGQTISTYRSAANGVLALSYTANGLYQNLAGKVDRFGNPIAWNTGAFRKYQAVNDMLESYSVQEKTYNTQLASLQQQLASAEQMLDSDSTQMGSFKWASHVNAISAQMNALGHTTNLTGQRAQVQQLSNQNNAAVLQEASVQQEQQEEKEALQQQANWFGNLVGGQQ